MDTGENINTRPQELELTALVWREKDAFVSLCPELGVSSCGSDLEEAHQMLREAVELYLENARLLGIWDDVVAGLGGAKRWTTTLKVAV